MAQDSRVHGNWSWSLSPSPPHHRHGPPSVRKDRLDTGSPCCELPLLSCSLSIFPVLFVHKASSDEELSQGRGWQHPCSSLTFSSPNQFSAWLSRFPQEPTLPRTHFPGARERLPPARRGAMVSRREGQDPGPALWLWGLQACVRPCPGQRHLARCLACSLVDDGPVHWEGRTVNWGAEGKNRSPTRPHGAEGS